MFRKPFSFGGSLLLAGAALLGTAGSGLAQHRGGGGGHVGGSHSGGFHGAGHVGASYSGGFHTGGFYTGGHVGASHSGGFHTGSFQGGGYHYGQHSGYRSGYGTYRYPRYYGSYGAWPYYEGYYPYAGYSYPDSYATDSYGLSSPADDSGYYGSNGGVTSSYPDSYAAASALPQTSANVTVSVPADAEIWINDTKMTSTGSVREYQSPPLAPGTQYTYELRARWDENGHQVTQTQKVDFTAGTRVNVHFPVRPTKAPATASR